MKHALSFIGQLYEERLSDVLMGVHLLHFWIIAKDDDDPRKWREECYLGAIAI